MKKVIGLCLVVLLGTTSMFARDNRRGEQKKVDPAARCERMITDLKLDDKQAAEFRKVQQEFATQAQKEREAMSADREQRREKMKTLREEQNVQVKKILTDEQYKQYLDKQQRKGDRKGGGHGRR